MTQHRSFALVFVCALAAPALYAQAPNIGFTYRSDTIQATEVLPNGTIQAPATLLTQKSQLTLLIRNRTPNSITLRTATATGPFTVALTSTVIDPENSVFVNLEFAPRQVGINTGTLTLGIAVDPSRVITYVFFLSGQGQAPEFVVSYILPNGNQLPIASGQPIDFSSARVAVGSSATATVVITNRGNGVGSLTSVAIAGDAFRIAGLPLLPTDVRPQGAEIRFQLTFAPASIDNSQGSLTITFGETVLRFPVIGQGQGPVLTYSVTASDGVVPVPSGGTVNVADTPVGETTQSIFTIQNNGNGEARISTIALNGQGFALADAPPLPHTLPVGATLNLTIRFSPGTTVGAATGTLRIDNASFVIRGIGVGRQLRITGFVGDNNIPLQNNGILAFQNANIGVRSTARVEVRNTGNAPAIVNVIAVTGGPIFALTDPPALPLSLEVGEAVTVVLQFIPDATGAAQGGLQIDDVLVRLTGVGNTPPPVPAVTFTGLPDQVSPLQQPSMGLRLEQPYALELTGRLTLSFSSEAFGDDPAIQFSTGGRTVDFRIPPGTTEAIFGQGQGQRTVQFQGGTVAGNITISTALATGRVNLTPNPAPSKAVPVPQLEPQLRGLQVTSRSSNSVVLQLSGISTPRSITALNFTFTAAPGASLQTTSLTSSVEEAFRTYYQSDASRQFGSQFTATISLNVAGDSNTIQSISVTAVNARGTSQPVSVSLR